MLAPKLHRLWPLLAVVLLLSCDDDDPQAVLPTWTLQGLRGQSVNEIKLNGQTLFAAA